MKADETREANGAKETNAAARGFDKAFDKVLGRSGASRPADGARSLRTAMTGRLVREWLVGWALSVVVLTALFFIAMGLCRLRIWYVWDPLYQTLITFKYRAPIYMTGLALAAGIVTAVVAAVRGARRAGDYLDGVARAAEGLVSAPGTLVELPAELSEIETRLNAARARAAAAEARADLETRRKNDLLVYLAHDLKTPLTSVIGYLQLLRDEGDISAKLRRRYEGVALEKAQRLEDLVNEFFEVARRFPKVKFIWFGHLPSIAESTPIRKAIREKPSNAIMPGYIEGKLIKASYHLASCMFFPSREETEGIVTLEALASKTPLLLRDIGVYDPWLVDNINCHKGKNVGEFVSILSSLLESGEKESILRAGYKVAEERNLEAVGKKLKAAYEGLLARKGR